MHSYRPSNAISAGSFILMLILAVIVGAIVGGILWAVDNKLHFYLVVAFPILAGAIAGGILTLIVRSTKVRNPLVAGLIGVVAGLIIYGVYHFATYYISFRGELRDFYIENHPGSNPTDIQLDDYINTGLMQEVGDTGFVGFIKFEAQTGFSITNSTSSTSSSDTDINIQGTGAYIYYAVELLIIVLVAGAFPYNAAREPFDENANSWYGKPTVFAIASTKSRKALMSALKDGSFQEAGRLLTRQQIKYPRIEIWARRSPDAAGQDVMLIVNHMQRKNRPNKIKSGMVSASELDSMAKAIDVAVAPNPVVSKA